MYYKLTDKKMITHAGMQWKLGRWHSIDEALRKSDAVLCSPHWFHCYNHPLLAVLFNPIHANIAEPRLFRCNVKGMKQTDNGVKFGFTFMRLVEELPLPKINIIQRVAFGIIAAREVYSEDEWLQWAADWLSGKDRYYAAADAAAAASAAASVAASAAASADAAADAAAAASAAASVAASAADAAAAASAAYAAAYAAANAAGEHLNLVAIAKAAMKVR